MLGLGFRILGSGFRGWVLRFEVLSLWGVGFRIRESTFGIGVSTSRSRGWNYSSRTEAQGSGLRVCGDLREFRLLCAKSKVPNLGFRVKDLIVCGV